MSGNNSGWNRPASNQPTAKRNTKAPAQWKGIAAGLAVVVPVIALCLWLFSGGDDAPKAKADKERGRIKEVKPAAGPKSSAKKQTRRFANPKNVDEAMANVESPPKPQIKKRELTPEEWNRLTNRVFKTGAEQLLGWVCQVTPGDMPMPIPNLGEEEKRNIAAILITKNPVKEGDSENLANLKQDVDYAKKEMAKYIADGGDPDDFMQYYFKELNRCFEYRNEALRQLHQVHDQEDAVLAKDFCTKLNERLREEGIKEIDYNEEFEDGEDPDNQAQYNQEGEQK